MTAPLEEAITSGGGGSDGGGGGGGRGGGSHVSRTWLMDPFLKNMVPDQSI